MTFTNHGFLGGVPLDNFTDREILRAVTLSIWLRRWNTGRFTKKNLDGDKVTASEMGGFASKIGISLGFYWARVTGLNVIDSPGEEAVKKYNGIRFG